jgi:O-antigen/teichoic acid export membrane protein
MIKTDTPTPSLRNHLIQGAFGSFGLKLGQTLLSLVWAVVLARLLGVDGFGIYVFCISIVNLLTIPSMLGGQQLLVREVAAYNAKDELHFLFGLLQRIRQATTTASILLSLCAAGVGWWIYQESPLRWPFLIAMSLIPLITAMNLQGAVLWGLRNVLLGQANRVLLPALCLVVISFISWFKRPAFTPTIALAAYAASAGLLVIAIHVVMRLVFPKSTSPIKPAYENSRWMHSMLPFMFSDAMQMLNNETSVVLLGAMQGVEAVGLFRVGQQGAGLVPFGLLAVNMAIAPIVAELFAKGEKQRLQNMISRSIIAIMGFAIPVALCLILGGRWLLPLVFGRQFAPAYIPLVVLCLGQLVNTCAGSVGLILNMVGLEHLVARGVAIAALINVALNAVLIPFWGPTGAAIASSTSLAIWNVLLTRWLYKKTGIISIFRLAKWKRQGSHT